VRRDRPVVELGGELFLAGGARVAGGARRAPGRRVAIGDHVYHPIDRLVVEDLVKGTEPRRRVVPRHHQEAEAL
jgi:hypothetical protein